MQPFLLLVLSKAVYDNLSRVHGIKVSTTQTDTLILVVYLLTCQTLKFYSNHRISIAAYWQAGKLVFFVSNVNDRLNW